ncbi:hypothetical protein V5799_021749, partial [Amblyomma americanum]
PSQVQNFSYRIVGDVTVRFTWEKPANTNGPIDAYCFDILNQDRNETAIIDVPGDARDRAFNFTYPFSQFNVTLAAYNRDALNEKIFLGPEIEVSFETLGPGPLPPRPQLANVTSNSVRLLWEKPQDPRYDITAYNVSITPAQSFSIANRSLTLQHLKAWERYDIGVASCINSTHCGRERRVQFVTKIAAPSKPLNMRVDSAGRNWVFVQWLGPKERNGPLSGYNISVSSGTYLFSATTTETSHNCTELASGTTYMVSVYAFNQMNSVTKRGPTVSAQVSTRYNGKYAAYWCLYRKLKVSSSCTTQSNKNN